MRVTEGNTYRSLKSNINRIESDLADLRTRGTTGSKLNKASDSPADIGPVFTTRAQLRQSERYTSTLKGVGESLNFADTRMGAIEDIMQRAREIALAGGNATSDQDRKTYANEVGELMKEMTAIGNTRINGNYIFAGYKNQEAPFSENPGYDPLTFDENDTSTWPVTYSGDNFPKKQEIAPEEMVESTITGNELFMGVANENFATDPTTPASGQANIFNTLATLQQTLLTGDAPALSNEVLGKIETAAEQNRNIRGVSGVVANHVDNAISQQEDVEVDLKTILSRYEDADALDVYSDMLQKENAFQAALSVTGRVSKISILDYI